LDITKISDDSLGASSPVRALFVIRKDQEDLLNQKLSLLARLHGATLLAEIKDMNTEIWEAIILTKQTGG
jgi:hypothetical protein